MDVRSFTVGQVAENCYLLRRDGADRGLIVDPGAATTSPGLGLYADKIVSAHSFGGVLQDAEFTADIDRHPHDLLKAVTDDRLIILDGAKLLQDRRLGGGDEA